MVAQEKTRQLRAEAFIARSREVHGGRYGYDEVRSGYVNSKTKVRIYCEQHEKLFSQKPHDHLKGQGCPDCGGRRWATIDARKARFVDAAVAVHGSRYRYDTASYIDARHDVQIECREHGWFVQRVTNHLRGQGCPSCRFNGARSDDRSPSASSG